jgi:hypothetical protein
MDILANNDHDSSSYLVRFIRLRQNTLWLATGMNGKATAPKLKERRRVGFGGIPLDTPPLAAGGFIFLIL